MLWARSQMFEGTKSTLVGISACAMCTTLMLGCDIVIHGCAPLCWGVGDGGILKHNFHVHDRNVQASIPLPMAMLWVVRS